MSDSRFLKLQVGLIWIWFSLHCLHKNNTFVGGLHFHRCIVTCGFIPFAKMEGLDG